MSAPSLPLLPNPLARRLFMERHGLQQSMSGSGKGDDLKGVIDHLGFVQVDSVNTVARAHHMILASRRQSYRPKHLKQLLEKDRLLFEHWTHDASVIPVEFYPHWKLKFARDGERLRTRWSDWQQHEFLHKLDEILDQISRNGPVSSGDVGQDEVRTNGGWWDWHPSKTALEYLWRTGALAVSARNGFQKVYDLTERVIPEAHGKTTAEPEETIDWACRQALTRLGFGTSGELAAFFALITPQEARDWCERQKLAGDIEEVLIEGSDGKPPRKAFAFPGLCEHAPLLEPSPGRVRILSPFDPMLRDRKRAERLFNFSYRIEIFVPEPQRTYGYYVFPVLEGERLIGRIDMKAIRSEDQLLVTAYWPEPDIRLTSARQKKLESELHRMARFCELNSVSFAEGWQKF
ncbi:winged helix-turn-helix domain-containing protein [Roseibium suaedae]|uniref:Winged helix-turn-helix domain-containing protein n=1 Tax=Roseibium suaedae TaxID=735517 RepID=A0A1M7D439_9HYPH|nr:crosslink repair DNA glycosylase YcaQ family protein [Roseibium suaedae]SHL74246.1 hypothetical protein SAMN05444272_1364 [Roseibium suaedae]